MGRCGFASVSRAILFISHRKKWRSRWPVAFKPSPRPDFFQRNQFFELKMKIIVCVQLVLFLNFSWAFSSIGSFNNIILPGNCRKLNRDLNKNMISASCKPRETLVPVHSDSPEVVILPNKLPVKKCQGGSCAGLSSCIATRTEDVEFAVRQRNFLTKKESCGVIKLKQDSHCQCGCSIREHHCTEKQIYKPNQCMCICKNNHEQNKCTSEEKIWDSHSCSCVCKERNPQCTTGSEWIPSMCRCLKIMSDEEDLFL